MNALQSCLDCAPDFLGEHIFNHIFTIWVSDETIKNLPHFNFKCTLIEYHSIAFSGPLMTSASASGSATTQPSSPVYHSQFKPGLFSDQVIVITGGGSGIGRCTAHELASLGATVALVGRSVDKLQNTADEIVKAGGRVSIHSCDIRLEDQVEEAFEAIVQQHGRIHGLVNNAGGQYPAPLEAISIKGWDAVVRNNLYGGFICAKASLFLSMKEHGGAIVNMVADMWNGMPGMGHSGAARAGMLNFTETAACEWAMYGVRVNAVAPGWIASSGFDTYDEAMKSQLRRLRKTVPLQRFGTEAEVAAAITFLLSPASAFITGTCIRIDGGVPNARHTWPAQSTNTQAQATQAFNPFDLATLPKMLDGVE